MVALVIFFILLLIFFIGFIIYQAYIKNNKKNDKPIIDEYSKTKDTSDKSKDSDQNINDINNNETTEEIMDTVENELILNGVGGTCPCDSTSFCGTDNKCYEKCVDKGSCLKDNVPRSNIYYCDYSKCTVSTEPKPEPKPLPVLSSVGGNCPCDESSWCNPKDNKCYETCVDKGKCDGMHLPRKNTYYCDYTGCTIGEDCPCDESSWCNPKDNKCYETCVDKGKCDAPSVPRTNTYYCNYTNC